MTLKLWVALFLAATITGTVAWFVFHESGIVVSIAICSVYIALLSAKLPIHSWIRLDAVQSLVEQGKTMVVSLSDPCEFNDNGTKRHVHFEEVVGHVSSEKLVRAYGAAKMSEKLLKDVRHDWEKGVGGAILLLVVWGVFAFARTPNSAMTTGSIQTFDWTKAGATVVIGFFRLFTSVEFLHWFRKQNSQI